MRVEEQVYRVEFPRREDLERLLKFGFSKVTGSKCVLEFDEFKKPQPKRIQLQKAWIRISGVPEQLLNEFMIVWSLGSLLGKIEKVDMPFTRKHVITRLLVGVLFVEFIPDFVPWSYDDMHYDLDVEIENLPREDNNAMTKNFDMVDGDVSGNQETSGNRGNQVDKSTELGKSSQPPKVGDASVHKGAAPSSTPMTSLHFGSFQAVSASSHLWGDRVEIETIDGLVGFDAHMEDEKHLWHSYSWSWSSIVAGRRLGKCLCVLHVLLPPCIRKRYPR
ncbi:hypothetical protein D1007_28197 [Hordeum vulgare]|nr:hypothetical protein D1007_28197 [Hordeum vulgare]